jgi:hypothetical protein
MTTPPSGHKGPLVAGPIRRVFHTLVALGGWVLFVYWWWLVFRHVSPTAIRFTLWFLALSLAAIVLVTALWAIHNVRMFRRKAARTHVRSVHEDSSHDSIGRPVGLPAIPEECLTASLIVVRIEDGSKVYRPTIIRTAPPKLSAGTES